MQVSHLQRDRPSDGAGEGLRRQRIGTPPPLPPKCPADSGHGASGAREHACLDRGPGWRKWRLSPFIGSVCSIAARHARQRD